MQPSLRLLKFKIFDNPNNITAIYKLFQGSESCLGVKLWPRNDKLDATYRILYLTKGAYQLKNSGESQKNEAGKCEI